MSTSTMRGRRRALMALSVAAALVVSPSLAHAEEPVSAKNIILLISDGAGYNQFDAVNFFETGAGYSQVTVDPETGAVAHVEGSAHQVYESFPVQVGQSHYAANGIGRYGTEEAWSNFDWVKQGPTDSAAAATALGTGVKTNNGMIGFDAEGNRLLTVGEQALAVGKKVGLVTSVPFNHATPAGFIAHNQSRNDYNGLATEMIDSGADVIMGGGHPRYTDANQARVSNHTWISQADHNRLLAGETDFNYIESAADFSALAEGRNVPEKVFGLARVAETLQYNRPGLQNNDVAPYSDAANSDVPTLETMTRGALNVLEQDEDGFFLMVEGGAIDWAGHANQTTRLIEEQIDFNKSVEAATAWVEENSSWEETLVIVSADHETGYLAGAGAGPGWTAMDGEAGELPNLSWHSGSHTNAIVPMYAKGVGSQRLAALADEYDLVRGAYLDNTEIGQTIFDVLGQAGVDDDAANAVAIEADVPITSDLAGTLSLTVADADPVLLTDDTDGQLPEVTVTDDRNEVQALGKGWTVSGAADDFTAGNRTMTSAAMSWLPRIVSSDAGADAGPQAAFEGPVTLASADRETRVGTTVADAGLSLDVPEGTASGVYGTEITLTLFAQD